MKKDSSDNGNSTIHVKELKNHSIIHEHDFTTSRTKNEESLVCSICGLVYCEKCGKLVNDIAHETSHRHGRKEKDKS